MRKKEAGKGGQKRGHFLGPTSPPNCLVACPHATTSINMNLNLELYFVHGEKKSYMRIQAFPIFPIIPYGQPNISNTCSLLPLLMRSIPYMVLLATR